MSINYKKNLAFLDEQLDEAAARVDFLIQCLDTRIVGLNARDNMSVAQMDAHQAATGVILKKCDSIRAKQMELSERILSA